MEQIKAMFEAMGKDESLAEKIQQAIKEGETSKIIAEAKQNGFNFTETDWQEYVEWSKSLSTETKGKEEISEENLENVAGGFWPGSMTNPHKVDCWFRGAGEPQTKYGTMRYLCGTSLCKAIPFGQTQWYQCICWGTDRCIEKWHNPTSH